MKTSIIEFKTSIKVINASIIDFKTPVKYMKTSIRDVNPSMLVVNMSM